MSQARIELLPRGHITAALTADLSCPLTVLAAATGYGKTTAAQAVLRAAPPAAYLAAPQGADSARYLWDYLCGRLAAQLADKGKSLALLLKNFGFPQDSASADRVLEQVRAHLDGGMGSPGAAVAAPEVRPTRPTAEFRPFLLILDDWHFAAFPEFDAFLERLVREAVPGLALLLLTRTRPGLALEELRMKGLARVFNRDLLAFSEEESMAYFALHGISNQDAARAAWRECEGWPAALWLSVQECAARPESGALSGNATAGSRPRRTDDPAAPPRAAENLLQEVVFSQYEEAEQRLLLRLSVLDSVTPQEAARLSDDPADAERLRCLYAKNAFLSLDPATGAFRPHSIFRAFLARRLEADKNIDKAELYRRAGECCAARGDLTAAAILFHRAGRDDDLLRLLELFAMPGGNLLLFLSAREIMPKVLSIPWNLRARRPLEYLAFIYFCLAEAGDVSAVALLDEAEQRFAADKSFSPALSRRLQGEAVLIRSMLAFNDLRAMRDIHAQAHELLHGRSVISSRHMIWTFGCPHAAYLYLREPGDYRDMVELVEADLHYFHDLSDGCSLGAEFLFRAEFLLERGEFAEVEGLLRAAALRAESKEQITTLLAVDFCLARLCLAKGRAEEAVDRLLARQPQIEIAGHVDLSTCLELALSYIRPCLGRAEDLPAWLRAGEPPATAAIPQMFGFVQALCGRAALLDNDWPRLEAIAKSLPASCGPYNNLFARIHAKMQEAVAARHLYGPAKALALTAEAVDLARPDGIILSLAEYGEAALPALRRLRAEAPDDAFLETLTKHTERMARLAHKGCAPAPAPAQAAGRARSEAKKEHLTARQREVLGLAAKGLSNVEIAAKLGISPVTVTKTLSAVYAKLKARNRAEAVRRFMEQGR